jgi:hypothetical protein
LIVKLIVLLVGVGGMLEDELLLKLAAENGTDPNPAI